MEYIKKEELKDGDIFVTQLSHTHFLNKYGTGFNLNLKTDNTIKSKRLYKNGVFVYNNMRLATPEEKHWLNECIKLDKFITFEEAMKTFIPEYVELINTGCRINCNIPAGKIYKCSKDVTKDYHFGFFLDSKYKIGFNKNEFNQYLKPSTKEAYDAQFVVIEPLPQFKVIETIETITKVENNEGNQFFIGDEVISSKTKIKSKIISFKYNVDKTAILAITDKRPNIGIGINHLEHYIEPKVEETLLDKAKKLYPVGTKFINPNGNRECVIKEKGNYFEGNNHNIYHSIANGVFKYEEGLSGCIYMNNTWSKIIE